MQIDSTRRNWYKLDSSFIDIEWERKVKIIKKIALRPFSIFLKRNERKLLAKKTVLETWQFINIKRVRY